MKQVAIPLLAAHLKTEEAVVMSKVASVTGVSSSGTVAQASRFHDDKSTYTGAHAAGGKSQVGCGRLRRRVRLATFYLLLFSNRGSSSGFVCSFGLRGGRVVLVWSGC